MAAIILRRLCGKCCQLNGISNFQARYLRHSVVFGKENASCSSVSKDDKETIMPSDVMHKRTKEFMANIHKSQIYTERKRNIESYLKKWQDENVLLPETIKDEHWYALLTERFTYSAALKYLNYVRRSEYKEKSVQLKQKEKKLLKEEKGGPVFDSYPNVSVHIPERDKQVYQWNKLKAWQSDIPVLIDMHFPDATLREQTEASNQLLLTAGTNARHQQPLQIHLTSVRENLGMLNYYESDSTLPIYYHEEHFIDVFPREKLVYLSPDGPPLRELDCNMIYVIGGLVDRKSRPRLTYSSAKEFGIQCASLPLANYVKLNQSARKDLNINVVFDIIQNMYLYHSWQKAFEISMVSQKYNVLNKKKGRK